MPTPPRLPALVALLSLTLLVVSPGAAQPRAGSGASACTAPERPLQTTICGDAELRGLDARLRGLEGTAAALGARQATSAHRARAWQAALDAGEPAEQNRPARPLDSEAPRDAYAERIASVEEVLRQDRAVRRIEQRRGQAGRSSGSPGAAVPRPATIERSCLGDALRACRVTAAGVAISDDGRTRILWQTQSGHTEADGVRAGIVLLAEVRGGWRLLGWSFEGHAYDAPRLIAQDDGLLLHVRGLAGGTGRANGELLYRSGPRGWEEIETESWWTVLPSRLPGGLELRQAVAYDFEQMAAEGRLWRAGDANCCPTGGGAMLDFRIEDRRLVLAGIGLDTVARAAPPRAEPCPAERAIYRLDAPAEWTAELRREGPPASDASDLLLRVLSGRSGRDYWFRFAAAQGYGGLTIWPVATPGPETAEDGVRDLGADDALRIDLYPIDDNLAVLPDPPRSGEPAPRRLFMPALGRALYYAELPQQADAAPFEHLPPGLWVLAACR